MIKVMSNAKLKKAVKAEKSRCILVVATYDNSIVAKLPYDDDLSRYQEKDRYMFYYINRGNEHEGLNRQTAVAI